MSEFDRWILAHSAPIGEKKLHAIGYITFKWNACELWLRVLLTYVTGEKFEKVWAKHHGSRAKEIAKQIRTAIEQNLNSREVKDAILHALKLYDINRLNRNQFTHFVASAGKGDGLELRNTKNSSWEQIFNRPAFQSDLTDIRRVAEEIETMSSYMAGIFSYFLARQYGEPEPPLPNKPPLPKRLWIPPQRSGSQPHPHRRRSSPPSQ